MTDLLSQDEIDALLHGVDDVEEEEVEESGDGRGRSATEYDFSSQDRIVRGRMPTLEMVNERFARHMRISLFNMMRRTAEVSINGVQMIKFGEYVHTLFVPTSFKYGALQTVKRHWPYHNRSSSGLYSGRQLLWWRWSLSRKN